MSVVGTAYQRYINSPAWRKKRQERLRLDQFRCSRCEEAENLEVHHKTYDRLGCERMDDLETLCNACHAREHDRDPNSLGIAGRTARERAACAETRWRLNDRNEILASAEKTYQAIEEFRQSVRLKLFPFEARSARERDDWWSHPTIGKQIDQMEVLLRFVTDELCGRREDAA